MTASLWREMRYAARSMQKAPGTAATAVLTLALGIGSATTMFTIVNAVLLKPLDYPQPDRLVRISGGATFARFHLIRQLRSLSETGAFLVVSGNAALVGPEGPEPLNTARVSANFISVLGVPPLLGRGFLISEETPGPEVAMISAELWWRRFGGDPRIIGTTVRLDAAPCTIVGVLPAGFSFPFSEIDIWRPLQPDTMPLQARLNSPMLGVFGRLRPDLGLAQASAEMERLNHGYALAHPEMLDASRSRPEPVVLFQDHLVRDVRSLLWMLFGAVAFVLLIACANVAGLLLARAPARSREFAIRAALGAGRTRLARQLLTESLLMSLMAGTLGVLFAHWGLRAIPLMSALELPRQQEVNLDLSVLAFAIALAFLATLLSGLAPSLSATRPDLALVMNGAAVGLPDRFRLWRSPRGVLVTGQVALTIVLMIGAALLMVSLSRLRFVETGFQSAHLLTMRIALPSSRYDTTAKHAAFFEQLIQRVESLPGVRNAAVTLTLPTTGWAGTPVHVLGRPFSGGMSVRSQFCRA